MTATLIRFERNGFPILEIRNRMRGGPEPVDIGQTLGFSAGDQPFAYDMRLERSTYDWEFTELTDRAKARVTDFFRNIAQGVVHAFDVTIPQHSRNPEGTDAVVISNARFMNPSLDWVPDDEGIWSVRLVVYTQVEGPTGPPITPAS